MPIPLLDLRQQYRAIREEALRVTAEIYDAQTFILGPRVESFERLFAAYCHTDHAVGVSSGTDALLVALMVLEIGAGDEVIVPAYSFFATAGVVHRQGATPVFVDVDRQSLNMDPAAFEAAITPRTKAVMPVHLYGQCADMEAINAIAAKHGIHVIEDAAQAVGAEFDGRRAGSLSPLGCFSFFPSKNLGAFGDAGAVTTSDENLRQKLVDYRVHGMRPKYYHHAVGGNFRIDTLQAAILEIKMAHLDTWAEGRRRNAASYLQLFTDSALLDRVELPTELPRRHHVFNQYILRFNGGAAVRDHVLNTLRAAEIGCEIYYPLTLPDQECFRDIPSAKNDFPVSREAAASSLAIPIFPELTQAQLEEIVATVARGVETSQ